DLGGGAGGGRVGAGGAGGRRGAQVGTRRGAVGVGVVWEAGDLSADAVCDRLLVVDGLDVARLHRAVDLGEGPQIVHGNGRARALAGLRGGGQRGREQAAAGEAERERGGAVEFHVGFLPVVAAPPAMSFSHSPQAFAAASGVSRWPAATSRSFGGGLRGSAWNAASSAFLMLGYSVSPTTHSTGVPARTAFALTRKLIAPFGSRYSAAFFGPSEPCVGASAIRPSMRLSVA